MESLNSVASFLLHPLELPLEELASNSVESDGRLNQTTAYPHPFFPGFSGADQLWLIFFQAELCNQYGEETDELNQYSLPPIPTDSVFGINLLERINKTQRKKG